MASGSARRRTQGDRRRDRGAPPGLRVRPFLPMARRPPALPGRRARAPKRIGDWILSRSRGRLSAGRSGIMGARRDPRPRRHDRRAARSVFRPGAELESAGAESARRRARGLDLAQRALPRQHAPRRDAAHRSRDGTAAPVPDPRGREAGGGRLPFLSARRPHRPHRARKPTRPLHGDRRGPRHRAGGLPRPDDARQHPGHAGFVVRARRPSSAAAGVLSAAHRSPASPPTIWRRSPAGGAAPTSPSGSRSAS